MFSSLNTFLNVLKSGLWGSKGKRKLGLYVKNSDNVHWLSFSILIKEFKNNLNYLGENE